MNTLAWLITYTVDGERRQVVHTHNAVADYPNATARAIDVSAVAELIAAAQNVGQHGVGHSSVPCVNASKYWNNTDQQCATCAAWSRFRAALARCEARS